MKIIYLVCSSGIYWSGTVRCDATQAVTRSHAVWYLFEKGTSELTVILLLLLSMDTTPPPRFPALPLTLMRSCRNCSWKSTSKVGHKWRDNTKAWLYWITFLLLLFKNRASSLFLACWARLTHKVGRIHDPILHWMSAVKCEFQDLLLFLPTLLPDDLLSLVQRKERVKRRRALQSKQDFPPNFETLSNKIVAQAFAHDLLNTADCLEKRQLGHKLCT